MRTICVIVVLEYGTPAAGQLPAINDIIEVFVIPTEWVIGIVAVVVCIIDSIAANPF